MTSSTTFPHSNPFAISVSTGSQRMTTWYMKHKFYPYAPMCLALYLSTYLAATFYNCVSIYYVKWLSLSALYRNVPWVDSGFWWLLLAGWRLIRTQVQDALYMGYSFRLAERWWAQVTEAWVLPKVSALMTVPEAG